jgi:hypothetical protein
MDLPTGGVVSLMEMEGVPGVPCATIGAVAGVVASAAAGSATEYFGVPACGAGPEVICGVDGTLAASSVVANAAAMAAGVFGVIAGVRMCRTRGGWGVLMSKLNADTASPFEFVRARLAGDGSEQAWGDDAHTSAARPFRTKAAGVLSGLSCFISIEYAASGSHCLWTAHSQSHFARTA